MAKPSSSATLNTGHALAASMVACYPFLENTGTTTAEKVAGTNTVALQHGAWATVGGDPVWRIAAAVADAMALTSRITLAGSGDWSVAFGVKTSGDTFEGFINGASDDSAWISTFQGSYLFVRGYVGFADDQTFTGDTSFTTYANRLVTYDHAANRIHDFKNGTEVSSSPLTPSGANFAMKADVFGSRAGNSIYGLVGDFYYWYAWNRKLSGADATSLNSDPYQMLTGGAGGGVTIPALERLTRGVGRGMPGRVLSGPMLQAERLEQAHHARLRVAARSCFRKAA